MKWFVKCIKNYVNFSGRARRSEYWYFILFMIITMVIAKLIDYSLLSNVAICSSIASLFFFLPNLAVQVRRLHDTGRSGKRLLWYYIFGFIWSILIVVMGISAGVTAMALGGDASALLAGASIGFLLSVGIGALIFFVWGIMFLVWYCTDGTKGENKYGPDPKAE